MFVSTAADRLARFKHSSDRPRRLSGRRASENVRLGYGCPLFVMCLAPAVVALGPFRVCPAQVRTTVADTTDPGASASVGDLLPSIVRPQRDARLSSPIDGTLAEIPVKEGQFVRAGQVVARLDNRVALGSLAVAQAAAARTGTLERARSELRWARRYLDRLLEAGDAASPHSLDQARGAVDRAAANLKIAEEDHEQALANVELQQARVALYDIRAPFAGTVVKIEATVGESVQRAQPLVRLVNTDRLETDLFLPVSWFGKIKPGQPCRLLAEAPVSSVVPATTVAVEPLIDATTRTFRCRVVIDNRSGKLPAGFAVRMAGPSTAFHHDVTNLTTP